MVNYERWRKGRGEKEVVESKVFGESNKWWRARCHVEQGFVENKGSWRARGCGEQGVVVSSRRRRAGCDSGEREVMKSRERCAEAVVGGQG